MALMHPHPDYVSVFEPLEGIAVSLRAVSGAYLGKHLARCDLPACATVTPDACKYCRGTSLQRYGSRTVVVSDLPLLCRPVHLHLKRQRWLCKNCGKTLIAGISSICDSHRATRRLAEHVAAQSQRRSYIDIARTTGLSDFTIRMIALEFPEVSHAQHSCTGNGVR